MTAPVKLLLFADTHLGFDSPERPLIEIRRRGEDFFANYQAVLDSARKKGVDLVVHGGDLFFRSRLPGSLVTRVYEKLHDFARATIPLCIVPGNHERSRLPQSLFVAHRHIHLFQHPGTIRLNLKGTDVALSGFPSHRGDIRREFSSLALRLLEEAETAPLRILCMHEVVEGAQVGPSDYTFREGRNVIRKSDIPAGFHAVLSGHIHRAQVLTCRPGGKGAPVPVIYPGSTERTSFAEKKERKGYFILTFFEQGGAWTLGEPEFHELPARPMVDLDISGGAGDRQLLIDEIREKAARLDENAIVRLTFEEESAVKLLTAATLRSLVPSSMNLEVRLPGEGAGAAARSIREQVENLPETPGVYLFLDRHGRVFYVGKSVNLKQRVRSYFSGRQAQERFKRQLGVTRVAFRTTATEFLALLLEDSLIKKYTPELNQKQKEFSAYRYLELTGDPFPCLLTSDAPAGRSRGVVFGPFGDHYFIDDLKELICRHFLIRRCTECEPYGCCVNHGMGLCSGPCAGSVSLEEYGTLAERARSFLQGEEGWLKGVLEEKMNRASEMLDFETAASLRDSLRFIGEFCRRQTFLARFATGGLLVCEPGPPAWSYLFNRGTLVRACRGRLDHCDAERHLQAARAPAVPGDPRHILDRGLLVYRRLKAGSASMVFSPFSTDR
jgi:DNA repair protein SbcD/Mre11